MMKNLTMKGLLIAALSMLPLVMFAQNSEDTTKGLDERINDWFLPIADWWVGVRDQ